jgi:periplasmic protein TonB
MSTIEIHEPEVKELEEVKAGRSTAAVLPSSELVLGPAQPARAMFSDSLLESGVQRKRRFFATTTSFIVNCMVIILMLAVPLMFTEELPKAQLFTFLVVPPPPPPPPPPAAAEVHAVKHMQTDLLNTGELRTPTKIPQRVQMIKEDDAPPPMNASGGVVGGVPGGIPGGQLGGVIGRVIARPHLGRRDQGSSDSSRRAHLSDACPCGSRARGRSVECDHRCQRTNHQPTVGSGHPMLVPAALSAVKQWRYKPYLLNGQPVEVETTITVIFTLSS